MLAIQTSFETESDCHATSPLPKQKKGVFDGDHLRSARHG